MEVSAPKQSHASGGVVDWVDPPLPRPAGVLVDAVNQAASKIQAGTVADGMTADEILADPEARERASRWRGGNASRKITAAFARLLNALHTMRAAKISQDAGQPPITEVLPVRGVVQGPQRADALTTLSMQFGKWIRGSVLKTWWVTMVMVVVVILFPKAVAAICTAVVKLVIRAMVAVFSRLLQEFWFELRQVFLHAFFAVSEIEDSLVSLLESWMGGPSWGSGQPEVLPPFAHPNVQPPPVGQVPVHQQQQNQNPQNQSKTEFLTLALLVLNLVRPHQGGMGRG